jgi:hypothetical protein
VRTAQSVGFGLGDDRIQYTYARVQVGTFGVPVKVCVVLKTPFAGSFGMMTSRA